MDQLQKDLEHLQAIRKEAANELGLTGVAFGGKVYDPFMRAMEGVEWGGKKMWGAGSKMFHLMKKVPGLKNVMSPLGLAGTALWVVPDMMAAAGKAKGATAGSSTARTISTTGRW